MPAQESFHFKKWNHYLLFREVAHIDFVIWTFFRRPPPPLGTAEASGALFIMQALRLSAVYKSIKVHLGQGQNLIISIQIYFQYK